MASGLAGLALGVAGALFGMASLAVAAGVCALAAAGASLWLVAVIRQTEELADGAAAVTAVRDEQLAAESRHRHVVDRDTGLPDARFFEVALEGRVAAARRHLWPVTVVLLEIGFGGDGTGDRHHHEALKTFTAVMRRTLREADIACRLGPTSFGLLLEDTSEEGGVWTAERLQIALARNASRVRRLAAGVAAYPSHGLQAGEVLAQARSALARACASEPGRGLGQVEVARAERA